MPWDDEHNAWYHLSWCVTVLSAYDLDQKHVLNLICPKILTPSPSTGHEQYTCRQSLGIADLLLEVITSYHRQHM